MMAVLRICLFGALRLEHEDLSLDRAMSHKTQGLLAYLLLHRDRLNSREVLAGIFWGDRSDRKARRCLNTALWRLRGVLEPEGVDQGAYLIASPSDCLCFNRDSDHWLDVAVFEEGAHQVLARPRDEMRRLDIERLQDSVQLCSAELLEGFYDDWALRERERLRLLHLRCLRRLMHTYRSQSAYHESLTCAQQILDCDPLREEIHREVMRLYCDMDQRTLALRQYQLCREILTDELGILPMEETQALYARIGGNGHFSPEQLSAAPGQVCLQQAMQQLRQAMDESALAQENLHRAMVQFDRLIPQNVAEAQLPQHPAKF